MPEKVTAKVEVKVDSTKTASPASKLMSKLNSKPKPKFSSDVSRHISVKTKMSIEKIRKKRKR